MEGVRILMSQATVLIVEDDADISEILSLYVSNAGYRVIVASTIESAWKLVQDALPDLILLDVNLPDGSGFDFGQKIRKISEAVIIYLTAYNSIDDKLQGFASGADDYITKPFIPKEVVVRIQAHLKRKLPQAKNKILHIGPLTLNFDEKNIYKDGELINLFTKEKKLLFYLVENSNKVISTEQLVNHIWGYDGIPDLKTVSVHISTLRRKIEENPSKPKYIQTVRGYGYKFAMD